MKRFPDKTEILCQYMMQLRDKDEKIVKSDMSIRESHTEAERWNGEI